MGILTEDIQAVRDRVDIIEVVGRYVELKKDGQQWVGLCPFHAEKSGSFKVSSAKGMAHCFGCKWGGDVISFVQEIEKVDFRTAVEMLAERAGIEVHYEDAETSESAKKRARLFELVAAAVDYYHGLLMDTDNPEARDARMYLRSRGINGEVARRFKLGWSPDRSQDGSRPAYDRLTKHLGASPRSLIAAGLAFQHERFGVSDAFRGRIMFPIFDPQGRPVAFGARILPGVEGPKYKNSTENALYQKSRVLYGLNWAKQHIVRGNASVVCEGYTDVIGLHMAGIENAVATCGTALTEDHVRLLARHAPRVIQAFDGDEAGSAGMERMHQWERHHGIEARVAMLPAGTDPADLARDDPDGLRRVLDEAVPLMRFRVERAINAEDTTSPEGKARAVDAAMEVVRSHPDPVVRDEYLVVIAAQLGLDVSMLRSRERRAPSVVREAIRSEKAANLARPAGEGAASAAIRVAFHRPQEIAPWLDRLMLPKGLLRDTYDVLAAGAGKTDAEVIDSAPTEVRTLLTEIAVDGDRAEEPVVVAADLAAAVLRRSLLAAADLRSRQGVDRFELLAQIAGLTGWLDAIQGEQPDPDVLAEVVDWIAAGGQVLGEVTVA